MENKNTINIGGGFFTTLTLIFIVLKLVGIIHWSWFWVLSPLIFSIILGIIFVIVMYIMWRKNL